MNSKQFKGPNKVRDAINDVVATLWENPDAGYSVYESKTVVGITYNTPKEVVTDEEPYEETKTEGTPEESETLSEEKGAVEEESSGGDVTSDIMETVVESSKGLAENGVADTLPDFEYAATIEDSSELVEYLLKFGFDGNPKNKVKNILNTR